MNLRNLSLLLILLIVVGCNQSENTDTTAKDQSATAENNQAETNADNSGEPAQPERIGKIVAKVNGKPIYEDDLNGKDLDFIVSEEVIYQAGLKQGLDDEVQDQVKQYERNLVIQKTKQKLVEEAGPTKEISDEEIERYYELNKDKYIHVRIHEISFPDVNMGEEIKEKIVNGEDLQEIAEGYPDVAVNVVDLGFNRELARTEFEAREEGAVSNVTQKENGTFRVLKIVEIKDIPLSTSKKSIRHNLEARRKGQMFEDHANKLAEDNNITIEIVEANQ